MHSSCMSLFSFDIFLSLFSFFFFFNDPATTEIYTLSLHDALPISGPAFRSFTSMKVRPTRWTSEGSPSVSHTRYRSEEHTSELQSRPHLVCRLLLEKKKKKKQKTPHTNYRTQHT